MTTLHGIQNSQKCGITNSADFSVTGVSRETPRHVGYSSKINLPQKFIALLQLEINSNFFIVSALAGILLKS